MPIERPKYEEIKKHKPITHVFAFSKDSIDTLYNAGDDLPGLKYFNPTVWNVLKDKFLSIFEANKTKIRWYIYSDNWTPTIINKQNYDMLTTEEKATLWPIKPI